MVAHQAIGVDHPVESINRFGQHRQKQRPVGVVPIDILPPVTTRSDVIKTVREFEAEGVSHGGIILKTGRSGKRKDLTPAPDPGTISSLQRSKQSACAAYRRDKVDC